MKHRIQGFAPPLAMQVEDALIAAGVPAHVGIAAHPLYRLAEQSRTVDEAVATGRALILVLWTQGHCWISAPTASDPCFHCFQLWRLHGWTVGFTRDTACQPDEFPAMSPAGDAWLAAMIAATAVAAQPEADNATGSARLVSIDRRSVSEHVFIRHPDCPRCEPLPDNTRTTAADMFRDDRMTSGLRGSSLRDIASAILPHSKDGRTGVVRHIVPRTSTPMLGMHAATLYPFKDPATVEEGFGRSGKAGDDATIALLEAIERFAGMRPRGQRTTMQGSYNALRDRAIDPQSFILHAPAQRDEPGFAIAEYSPDTVYDWVWGYSFRRGGEVLVPLQLAYYGLGRSTTHVTGGRFVYEISNGCAIGSSMAEATLHGLLEIIERDAFLASWYSGRELHAVDARDCADPFVQAMLARLCAEGLDVEVYDIRCGLPPAAFAVRITDPDLRFGPAAVYAAGAHLDRDKAMRAAFAEAVTFVHRYDDRDREDKMRKAEILLDNPAAVGSMADHSLQCWPLRALRERSFPIASGPKLALSAIPTCADAQDIPTFALMKDLVEATLSVAADVITIDQGFEPFRSDGLHCAKVLAPGLLPMTFGHRYRRISTDRLMQMTGRDGVSRFRDDPHVFP